MDENQRNFLFFFFDRLLFARTKYEEIKQDEEKRKISTSLGRRALFYGVLILIFVGGAAAMLIWGISLEETWKQALIIVGAILIVLIMIPFYILALNLSIKQLCLNKRAIGWISLLLPILTTIAVVVCIAVFVQQT